MVRMQVQPAGLSRGAAAAWYAPRRIAVCPFRLQAPYRTAANELSHLDQRRRQDNTTLCRYRRVAVHRYCTGRCRCAAWAVYAARSPEWTPTRARMAPAADVKRGCLPGIGMAHVQAAVWFRRPKFVKFTLSTPIESSKSYFSCRSTPSDPPVRPLVVRGP